MAVGLLRNLTISAERPGAAVTLFLLGDILNRFDSNESENQQILFEVVFQSRHNILSLLNICVTELYWGC